MALQREFLLDETKGPIRFKIIWNAVGFVPPNGQHKGIEILRREASIARKLRFISYLKDNESENNTPAYQSRELKDGDQKLTLDQPEIDMIRQKIEAYPFWNPLAEDSPADVYDWLSTGRELSDDIIDKAVTIIRGKR